jgi:hypothetical protein
MREPEIDQDQTIVDVLKNADLPVCPSCSGKISEGMVLYSCEVCRKYCCSECSDTCAEKNPVCEDCLAGGYEDGYRQSRDG